MSMTPIQHPTTNWRAPDDVLAQSMGACGDGNASVGQVTDSRFSAVLRSLGVAVVSEKYS